MMNEAAVEEPLAPSPIMDLPPEVFEMILKNVVCGPRPDLRCRLVNSTWKTVIDDVLEKKCLKGGKLAGCPTLFCEFEPVNGEELRQWIRGTISCPTAILNHTGNPFPSNSLIITARTRNDRQRGERSTLDPIVFMERFGNQLTTLSLDFIMLTTDNLIQILSHVPNLKVLKIKDSLIKMVDEVNFESRLPALPKLRTLLFKLNGLKKFRGKHMYLIDAYAVQLESLELEINSFYGQEGEVALFPERRPLPDNKSAFQNLRQLKIFNPTSAFFQLSVLPPLKRLSIVAKSSVQEMPIDVLMQFVDKFNETLEILELDVTWQQLFCRSHTQHKMIKLDIGRGAHEFYVPDEEDEKARKAGGKLSTAAIRFSKLSKLTLPFPSSDLESEVVIKTFLAKFPALEQLALNYFEDAVLNHCTSRIGYDELHQQKIQEVQERADYWEVCKKLQKIHIWFTGEGDSSTPTYCLGSINRGLVNSWVPEPEEPYYPNFSWLFNLPPGVPI